MKRLALLLTLSVALAWAQEYARGHAKKTNPPGPDRAEG